MSLPAHDLDAAGPKGGGPVAFYVTVIEGCAGGSSSGLGTVEIGHP